MPLYTTTDLYQWSIDRTLPLPIRDAPKWKAFNVSNDAGGVGIASVSAVHELPDGTTEVYALGQSGQLLVFIKEADQPWRHIDISGESGSQDSISFYTKIAVLQLGPTTEVFAVTYFGELVQFTRYPSNPWIIHSPSITSLFGRRSANGGGVVAVQRDGLIELYTTDGGTNDLLLYVGHPAIGSWSFANISQNAYPTPPSPPGIRPVFWTPSLILRPNTPYFDIYAYCGEVIHPTQGGTTIDALDVFWMWDPSSGARATWMVHSITQQLGQTLWGPPAAVAVPNGVQIYGVGEHDELLVFGYDNLQTPNVKDISADTNQKMPGHPAVNQINGYIEVFGRGAADDLLVFFKHSGQWRFDNISADTGGQKLAWEPPVVLQRATVTDVFGRLR